MTLNLTGWKRTLWCGELRKEHVGQEVVVTGWAHSHRDHGDLIFVDLRDRSGLAQVVFDPSHAPDSHKVAEAIRKEWVLGAVGKVRPRPDTMINPKMDTGEVEVLVDRVIIFNKARPVPFQVVDETDATEELRLRYRYIDLRRPALASNFARRHRAYQAVRQHLSDAEGFLEIETPFMTKYTPGGARNYLVPSRVHPGQFYALTESPQIFKQLLMVSGFERYFQIVRCFRDEDPRADRQPEFTQIDLEMSFADEDDVMGVVERMLSRVWKDVLDVEIPTPFPRMTYAEAMGRYGSDKPDLRFDLPLTDVSDVAAGCGFGVFENALADSGSVVALRVPGGAAFSRKVVDDMKDIVAPFGAKGVAWAKVQDDGSWTGAIAKFFSDEARDRITKKCEASAGDLLTFVADQTTTAQTSMGILRLHFGRMQNLIDESLWRFCWVHEFPLFEKDAGGNPTAVHHPFTSPRAEDVDRMADHPYDCKARAYDVVLNGTELGGGSVRIHDAEVQNKVFQALRLTEEEIQAKFRFLLDAFSFGAPPHAGLAIGMDRLAMLLAGASSLRDVIAFPKTQRATDLMIGSPSPVDEGQLAELSIRVIPPKK